MQKTIKGLFLITILAIPVLIFLFLKFFGSNKFEIPVYYTQGVESSFTECNFGKEQHVIPPFNLLAHTGASITESHLDGNITVVDFFFTTCPSICPIMSTSLTRVQDAFEDKGVQLVSFSVDPENDSIEALQAYAKRFDAKPDMWTFVTGSKPDIYRLARCGFILPVIDGDGSPEDFIHSDKLILIDKQRRIRGYYSGTDTEDVDRLIVELKILLEE
ncbi:SCO family protein [Cytophagales bacterium LB-30]|uniref:SCO family protein n=1 Tax=Shiella aurantiaca TaxID=3058365 RepID=A0ABT8F443_9BACT|nr:SCO family protein [Shiella aurantiaca]MDN4165170.1 SCO family protein [Shiella aurantiaca]